MYIMFELGIIKKMMKMWKWKPAGFCLVADICERKPAEQEKHALQAQLIQAQKIEALGALRGAIAHDFNNMLQTIVGSYQSMTPSFLQLPYGTHSLPEVRSRCWKIG